MLKHRCLSIECSMYRVGAVPLLCIIGLLVTGRNVGLQLLETCLYLQSLWCVEGWRISTFDSFYLLLVE